MGVVGGGGGGGAEEFKDWVLQKNAGCPIFQYTTLLTQHLFQLPK